MSTLKEVGQLSQKGLEKVARKLQTYLDRTDEEKLLEERERRRRGLRGHQNAYIIVNLGLLILFGLVLGVVLPNIIVAIGWGIGLAFHTVGHRNWLEDHRHALQDAELKVLGSGKASARQLIPAATGQSVPDSLLLRCEKAAEETRARLNSLEIGQVEAMAVIQQGLDRVREMLNRRVELLRALQEADPATLQAERSRLEARLAGAREAETRALYQEQLSLLHDRENKAAALRDLLERMEAYAESYLAGLANLRMDAARIHTLDLPAANELAELMKPVRQLEQNLDGMRNAMQEVARVMR